ncbi:MAG: diacylglycerol kinase [Roseobacter sp.]|nr:diacylglycerol kinase [Roseobacter sp.]
MQDAPQNPIPEKTTGVAHLFAATRYSFQGLLRLWGETAFRHELLAGLLGLGLLLGMGAPALWIVAVAVLALLTLAIEALNTAIEEIVDHVSPEWSRAAKHAKDMGSFAVMALLLATGLVFGCALWSSFTA